MRVVVTGATSFIGAAAIRQLVQNGHEVCAVVRPRSRNLENLNKQVPEGDRTDGRADFPAGGCLAAYLLGRRRER